MKKAPTIFAIIFALVLLVPALTFAATFNTNLTTGSTGTAVTQLQQFLTVEGFFTATPNAKFGPATKTGVVAFQKQQGITPNGSFGPVTRAAANAVVTANPSLSASLPAVSTTTNASSNSNSGMKVGPSTGLRTSAILNNRVNSPVHNISPNPTAICRDGTYGFGINHGATCYGHGGLLDSIQ